MLVNNRIKQLLLYFPLVYIIFFPTFIGGISLHQGQTILYLTYPFILLFILFSLKKRKLKINNIVILLLVIFLLNLIGIYTKSELIESFGSYVDYFRYLVYSIIFFISFNISIKINLSANKLKKIIIMMSYMVLIFILLQAITNNSLVQAINSRPLINFMGLQIGGPFIWSYSLGFFLILVFYIKIGEIYIGNYNFYTITFTLLTVFVLIFTQSKGVYLSILMILLFLFFAIIISNNVNINKKLKLSFYIFLSIFILISIIYTNIETFGNISRFIDAFLNNEIDASTNTRLNQLDHIYSIFDKNILFGYPQSDIIIENAYGYYLYTYGILGLCLYILLIVLINIKNFNILKHVNIKLHCNDDLKILSISFFAYSFSVFFISLGAPIIDGHKAGYLFWTLLGLYYGVVDNYFQLLKKEKDILNALQSNK